MKKIEFLVNHKDEETGQTFTKQSCICTEEQLSINVEIVEKTAYNGEYTIEDVDEPENIQPADTERIAELEEALELLLSGVTE